MQARFARVILRLMPQARNPESLSFTGGLSCLQFRIPSVPMLAQFQNPFQSSSPGEVDRSACTGVGLWAGARRGQKSRRCLCIGIWMYDVEFIGYEKCGRLQHAR